MANKNVQDVDSEGQDGSYIYAAGVQVGTGPVMKWQSTGLRKGDRIPVVSSSEDEFWILERDHHNPWWSFYKPPDQTGEKLYVTYNKADNSVSLQPYDKGQDMNKRWFFAFLQPDGKYALTSKDDDVSSPRFLGKREGFLVMTDAQHPEVEEDWIISPEIMAGNRSLTTYFYIRDGTKPAEVWISGEASWSDRIPVAMSDKRQEWALEGGNKMSFKVPNTGLYASRNDSESEITFEEIEIEANKRKFDLVRHGKHSLPGVLLQSASNGFFVGRQELGWRTLLELKKNDKEAVKWGLQTTRIGMINEEGKPIIFPMFETEHPDY